MLLEYISVNVETIVKIEDNSIFSAYIEDSIQYSSPPFTSFLMLLSYLGRYR